MSRRNNKARRQERREKVRAEAARDQAEHDYWVNKTKETGVYYFPNMRKRTPDTWRFFINRGRTEVVFNFTHTVRVDETSPEPVESQVRRSFAAQLIAETKTPELA